MKNNKIADLVLWEAKNRKKTAIIGIALTAIMVILTAYFLRLEFTFASIMPANGQKVQDLNRIMNEFPEASTIIGVLEGNEESIVEAAREIKQSLETDAFKDIVYDVEISIDSSFLISNAILLEPIEEYSDTDFSKFSETDITENDFYFLNDKRDTGLVFIHPSFNINDFMVLKPYVLKIDEEVKRIAKEHGIDAGITGMNVVGKDEAVTSEEGIILSTTLAFIFIIFLLAINFRKKSIPIIAAVPLIAGIIWTLGLTALFVRRLNIMTAMYMIALMGIGIDFSIHFITAWIQEMEEHNNFYNAIFNGAKKSSTGIITGGLTSAAAFFALAISNSPLVKELGLVAGLGIICELIAAFVFLPILLPRVLVKDGKKVKVAFFEKHITAPIGFFVSKFSYGVAVVMLLIGIGLSFFSNRVTVQTNLMEMEAKGLESVELQDRMVEKFGQSPDGLYIISDSVEMTREIVSDLRDIEEISSIDSIITYLPSKELQEKRLEMGLELKPFIETLGIPLEIPEKILTLDDIPSSIKQKYFSSNGELNLITIIPGENCWEKENRDNLVSGISMYTDKATGLILIGDQLSEIAGKEGIIASLVALLAVFFILFINFRNLWATILTTLPLLLSIGSLLGIMGLTNIKFDFVNIIAIPLIIGIGIDDAVHLSHRFISQKEKIEITVRFIGRAILLTTLTTAIGFASFIPSVMRALRSTGIVLTLAVTLTFIFSIFFHSAVLKISRDKLKINLESWF